MTIKIFLGNLNSDTTSDKLRPLFEKYGEVTECDVLKNFGFVHMINKQEANRAIAQLDGYNVDGNNIRVELSTGKKGPGGGGGKFDKKGFGNQRGRPYGPPPGRGPRDDFDRYPYPPPPPLPYDRYDPYYRYYLEREAFYARVGGPLPGERGYPPAGERDRYPPLPRERVGERYPPPPDPRDRLPPPRSFMGDRGRIAPPDPYFRERDPLAARPPPEYYDRKPPMGRGADSLIGAAGAVGGRGSAGGGFNGVGGQGDYSRGSFMDRAGGAGLGGGAAGGIGGGQDFFRGGGGSGGGAGMGQQSYNSRVGMGGGRLGNPDSQTSFATDAIFF